MGIWVLYGLRFMWACQARI